MTRAPEVVFLEQVVDLCRLARKRAKDPRESRAAADLEIELGGRIKALEAAEAQPEQSVPSLEPLAIGGAR